MATLTEHEQSSIDQANASGLTPVVFIHGLWLLPSSWDRWRAVFEEAGYSTVEAKDGASALAAVARERPALILLGLLRALMGSN